MRTLAISAMAVLLLTNAAARAESCNEAVDRLAARYDLAAEDRVAGGGGLAPPAAESDLALEPPLSGSSSMPAFTSAPPHAGGDAPVTGSQADPQHLSVAMRSEAEALLQAARGEASRGKPDECLRRLREAETVLGGG
jgi:hypothetical protein